MKSGEFRARREKSIPRILQAWAGEHGVLLSAGALFTAYMVWVILRPAGIFWSPDEAGKFIFLKSFLIHGDATSPLVYPARVFDPGLNYVSLYYSIRLQGQLYSWWPVGFPLLNAPFYLLFGWVGLYLLPALGGAITALFAGLITRRLYPGSQILAVLAVWITGLATPVAFYSTMFWEHSLNLAAFLACFYYLVIYTQTGSWKMVFLAGSLASLAVFLRTETVMFFIGLGLVVLIKSWRKAIAYAAGFSLVAAGWMAFNQASMGNFISRQFDSLMSPQAFSGVSSTGLKFFPYLLFNFPFKVSYEFSTPLLIAATVFTGTAVLAGFIRSLRWASLAAALGLAGICAWVLFSGQGYTFLSGFLLLAPFVVFAGWLFSQKDAWNESLFPLFVLVGGVVFGAAFIVRAWFNAGGLQWGPRYLLVYYPLLVIAALVGLAKAQAQSGKWIRRASAFVFLVGVLVGFGFEVRGGLTVWLNDTYGVKSKAALADVMNKPTPLTVSCVYLPMLIPDLYWQGNVVYVPDNKITQWQTAARSQGITTYGKVNSDLCQWINLTELADLRHKNPSGISVDWVNLIP